MGFACCVLFVFVVESQRDLFVTVPSDVRRVYNILAFTTPFDENARSSSADKRYEFSQSKFLFIDAKYKWIRVIRSSAALHMKLDGETELISNFHIDLFIQACIPDVDCLARHLFSGGNGGESIVISGKGFAGDVYLRSPPVDVRVGRSVVDGEYFLFNVFSFGSEFKTLNDKTVSVQLEGLSSTSKKVEHQEVTVKKYDAPEVNLRNEETEKVMIKISFSLFAKPPQFMIGVCSKETFNSECNKGNYHTKLRRESRDGVNLMFPYEDTGIYYDISVYFFYHRGGTSSNSRLAGIHMYSLRGLGRLFDEHNRIPCGGYSTSLFFCHMIKCHAGNKYCNSVQTKVKFNVKVKSSEAQTLPIYINGVKYGRGDCVTSQNSEECEILYEKDTNIEVHEVLFRSCAAFLMKEKNAAFDMCSGSVGLEKVVITRL